MELAGVSVNKNVILEADKRSVITQKIKFPKELSKEIADFAHNLSDKYSIWIASSLQKMLLTIGYIDKDGNLKFDPESPRADFMPTYLIEEIRKFIKSLNGDYHYILDWLKGRTTLAAENDQINFKTLTFEEAKKRSQEWHKKLEEIQGNQIQDEDGEIIMNFPDGFYWIKIGKDYCPKEAEAMGHCGRASGSILYSLRKDQYPYVTAAIRESNGAITQMKGRANTKPKAQFHKYIIPFILSDNVISFNSSYSPQTDFNINDLGDVELKQVVDKKPSLLQGDGVIALKRLDDKEIKVLLTNNPKIIDYGASKIPLSDVLKNEEMVNWALANKPELFLFDVWGSIILNNVQLKTLFSVKVVSDQLNIDEINIDAEALNWIVTHRPELFSKSITRIRALNDSQKDYLVKNYPEAFRAIVANRLSVGIKTELDFFGVERLQTLFQTTPQLFDTDEAFYLAKRIFTPPIIEKYIKSHNKENDPVRLFNNTQRLSEIYHYFNIETGLYVLKHYPEIFRQSGAWNMANRENGSGAAIGRYIVDHHFDWIEQFFKNGRDTFNIMDWNLSTVQKQKIVNSDIKGDTQILLQYNAKDLSKLNLSPKQINELINSDEIQSVITMDMIIGFNLSPEKEQTSKVIINALENNEDNSLVQIGELENKYGEKYVHDLYDLDSSVFKPLLYPVKYRDVERLKKYNNQYVTYTDKGVKIRFNDWTDDDLLQFFEDSRDDGRDLATNIANWELDFHRYSNTFNEVSHNFDDLDKINIARIRFLLIKSFPEKYKDKIKTMSISSLADVVEDPESMNEGEAIDYNEDIIDAIKDAFTKANDEAQQSADEGEYWNLYTKPIENLLGGFKFVDLKVKKKDSDKIETKQYLEFEIPYEKLQQFVIDASEVDPYSSEVATIYDAGSVVKIIADALSSTEKELKINTPHYGVNGDIKKEDLNERFSESIFDSSTTNQLLSKAKVVVNKKKNEPK